jgi:hypothetical protein
MEGDIKAYLDKNNVPWREETDLASVAPEVDCIYMTRIQKERFHSPEDYQTAAGKYILTMERVRTMKPGAIIMHPLPRVDEIPKEVDDDPRARYFQQAQNGLYIRMAAVIPAIKKRLARVRPQTASFGPGRRPSAMPVDATKEFRSQNPRIHKRGSPSSHSMITDRRSAATSFPFWLDDWLLHSKPFYAMVFTPCRANRGLSRGSVF